MCWLTTRSSQPTAPPSCDAATLDDVLGPERSSVVPLIDSTRHLINTARLAQMKPTAYLLNAARGGIVDEAALADALKHRVIAGAALDVFEQEPPTNTPLLGHPNVLVTPHLGASTVEAQALAGVDVPRVYW